MNTNVRSNNGIPFPIDKHQCRFCPYRWKNSWNVKRHEAFKHRSQLAAQPSPVQQHVYQLPTNQAGGIGQTIHYIDQIPGQSMQYPGSSQPPIHPQQEQFHPVPVIQPPVLGQPVYVNPQPSTHYQLPNQNVASTGLREGDGFLNQQQTELDDLNSISSSYYGVRKRDLLDSTYNDDKTVGSEEDYSDDDSVTGEPLEIHDEFKLISDRIMENIEIASDIRNDYALLINKINLMKFDNGKEKESMKKLFAMYVKYREKIDLFMNEEFNFVWRVGNSKEEEDSESEEEDSESEEEEENDESDTEEMEGDGDCDGNINEAEEGEKGENVGTLRRTIRNLKSFRYYDWIWQVMPKKMFDKFLNKMSEKLKEEPEYYNGDLEDCLKQVQRVKKKWKHCGSNQFYDCSRETINAICKCFYDIDQGRLDYSKNDRKKIHRILGITTVHVRSLITPACSMERKRKLLMHDQVGKQIVFLLSQVVIPETKSTLADEN